MKNIRFYLLASFAIGIELSGLMIHMHSSRATPVVICRRSFEDIYTILQQDKTDIRRCPVDNATYLVKERQCIDNHYLFNGNMIVLCDTDEL